MASIEHLTKGQLMKVVFGDTSKIDAGLPKEFWSNDNYYMVMDYRTSFFGELKDMRQVKPELFKPDKTE